MHAAINNGMAGCATGVALGWKGAADSSVLVNRFSSTVISASAAMSVRTTTGLTMMLCAGGPMSAAQSCVGFGLFSVVFDYLGGGAAQALSISQSQARSSEGLP